ncbi:MAG TPA: substrate-binding domain-containing protein [Terracidiphilus sp.]|nr:substrate-binding domain-containing protein [Terracidiphilus sp.]
MSGRSNGVYTGMSHGEILADTGRKAGEAFSRPVYALILLAVLAATGCRQRHRIIAVIPRTCGTALWEPEHAGADAVARQRGLDVYWNAPTRDDDIQAQIALIEKSVKRGYAGIIVSPIETLPMRTPIRRVLAKGVPVVVVGTELGIAPGPKLAYVMSDEHAAGEMAARRIGSILEGKGSIAILGIDPQLMSNVERERSLETALAREFPGIHVAVRQFGLASVPQEQEAAEELLAKGQKIDAIVALSLASTRGAYYALVEFGKAGSTKLVGFDQDLIPPIRNGGIDSVVAQNTYAMGQLAMDLMDRELHGKGSATVLEVPPVLMTRENVDSAQIRQILNLAWWPPQ